MNEDLERSIKDRIRNISKAEGDFPKSFVEVVKRIDSFIQEHELYESLKERAKKKSRGLER